MNNPKRAINAILAAKSTPLEWISSFSCTADPSFFFTSFNSICDLFPSSTEHNSPWWRLDTLVKSHDSRWRPTFLKNGALIRNKPFYNEYNNKHENADKSVLLVIRTSLSHILVRPGLKAVANICSSHSNFSKKRLKRKTLREFWRLKSQ